MLEQGAPVLTSACKHAHMHACPAQAKAQEKVRAELRKPLMSLKDYAQRVRAAAGTGPTCMAWVHMPAEAGT